MVGRFQKILIELAHSSINHTIYIGIRVRQHLASLTCRVGDRRVHRLLPTQQALYNNPDVHFPGLHSVGRGSKFSEFGGQTTISG